MTRQAPRIARAIALLVQVMYLAWPASTRAQSPPAERFTATADWLEPGAFYMRSAMDITVTLWTGADDARRLFGKANDGDQRAFRASLAALPSAGSVHEFLQIDLGERVWREFTDLRCAAQVPTANGRRILLVSLIEDGRYALTELKFDRRGRGSGRVVETAVMEFDHITGLLLAPRAWTRVVRLTDVRAMVIVPETQAPPGGQP